MEYINEIHKRDITLIERALYDLNTAVEEMNLPVYPHVPLPRPKLFRFTVDVIWPYLRSDGSILFNAVHTSKEVWPRFLSEESSRERVATKCLENHASPSGALNVLRRIQAATAWCYARAEGRKRAAQEILRQQKKASEVLDIEAVLCSLSS